MGVKTKMVFHTKEVIKKMEDTAMQRMLEVTNEVRNTTLETLSGDRSGRTYNVPGTKRTYTASAPGEPPAVATAQLRESVRTEVSVEAGKITGRVGTELEKGRHLEFGTRYMKPRPWLRISFFKALDEVKSILSRKWM